MQKRWVNSLLVMASVTLVACDNGVNFTAKALGLSKTEETEVPPVVIDQPPVTNPPPVEPPPVVVTPPPVEPPPVVVTPPPVEPPPVVVTPPTPVPLSMKSGTCSMGQGEQVLSCLNCQSTPDVQPPPLLSRKAQELLEIMTAGCSVHNESDPRGYVAPSQQMILQRLAQCSPTLYPDTTQNATQKATIAALLKNKNAQQTAFGNLYYNWASTDFETYFGLEISEARYTFCRGATTFNGGGVYPKEYWDAMYSGMNYTLPAIWQKAQKIRETLRNCMAESLRNPNPQQAPTIPGKVCRFETAEGDMGSLVTQKANEWLNAGHKVYFEGSQMCGQVDKADSLSAYTGKVTLAIKVCDP